MLFKSYLIYFLSIISKNVKNINFYLIEIIFTALNLKSYNNEVQK